MKEEKKSMGYMTIAEAYILGRDKTIENACKFVERKGMNSFWLRKYLEGKIPIDFDGIHPCDICPTNDEYMNGNECYCSKICDELGYNIETELLDKRKFIDIDFLKAWLIDPDNDAVVNEGQQGFVDVYDLLMFINNGFKSMEG